MRHALHAAAVAVVLGPLPAPAAAPERPPLGLAWTLHFAGLLLCIALGPLLFERLWHRRLGGIAALWAALMLVPWAVAFGPGAALAVAWHAILLEYLPFVAMIFALFTVGGGIVVQGGP